MYLLCPMVKARTVDPASIAEAVKLHIEQEKIIYFPQIFKHLSREYVARISGISRHRMLYLYHHPRSIRIEEIEKIAEGLNITTDQLNRLLRRF